MANKPLAVIAGDGLWRNNQALVALLGLCPLLATTTSATTGLGMGVATAVVLLASNSTLSLIRHLVRPEIRLPVFVVAIAAYVSVVDLAMQAYFLDLHKALGIFVPLIAVNCVIVGRAEVFASKNPLSKALLDALGMGMGFVWVLCTLGGLRELIGQGTLFAQAQLLFGEWAEGLTLSLGPQFHGALAALLPPGAFFGLGLLIALKNLTHTRLKQSRGTGAVSSGTRRGSTSKAPT
jgi:electron transport complex protein RnfE